MKLLNLNEEKKKEILAELSGRSHTGDNDEYSKTVNEILENVRQNGDKAVFEYTKRFDGADIDETNFIVSKEEIDEAYKLVGDNFVGLIRDSIRNIKNFHSRQVRQTFIDDSTDGIIVGQRIIPLEIVGLYVPGGKAAYPSSVLMNAIPAKVAGVKCIQIATPADKNGKVNPNTLVAANEAGVDVIYKMGGAQAIG
ncbi:MAG: histidinol dehydrogenase, partial [Lachnospiraceae bacterium]|nr:histidinol dehydrogenase [Lachnospiraceae bacterium]